MTNTTEATVNENESSKCECEVDLESYHQCKSCAEGKTNPLYFLTHFDMMDDEFLDHVPEY